MPLQAENPGSALSPARRRLLGCAAASLGMAMPAAASAADIEVRDDRGELLRLHRPARRVVALSPQLVELCFAAGAGSRLVGTVRGADRPPQARSLARVGDAFALNLEALALLRPDLILAWRSGTPQRQVAALQGLGIPVYWSEARSLEAIADTVLRIGRLAGTEPAAQAWADAYRQQLRQLRLRYSGATAVRVFYQVWPAPLMTIGGVQLIDSAIRLCGGVNVFGDLQAPAPQVSREAVLARDPQLIVAASSRPDALRAWQAFGQISAVRHQRLVLLDPDALPGMGAQVLSGVEQLCRAIQATRRSLRAEPAARR